MSDMENILVKSGTPHRHQIPLTEMNFRLMIDCPGGGRWDRLRLQRSTGLRQHQQLQHPQDSHQVPSLGWDFFHCPVIRAPGWFLVSVAKSGRNQVPVFTNVQRPFMALNNASLTQNNTCLLSSKICLLHCSRGECKNTKNTKNYKKCKNTKNF